MDKTIVFTIHYDGEKIANHKMRLDDFVSSIQGFNDLLKELAKEIGIPKECFQLQIQPLENGGVKAYIVAGIIGLSTFILGHLGDHLLDDINLYERSGLSHLAYRLNQFLDRKKSVSNYKDINQLTSNLDVEATHIMLNKQIHNAAQQFTSVLAHNVDKLELSSTTDSLPVKLVKNDCLKFQNPFVEQDLEERVYEEERKLRLEGPRCSNNEWIFYEEDINGNWNKDKEFRAIVLDDFLLSFGRENSLQDLKDKDLYCTVRYKEIIKPGNTKKSIERYIINCKLKQESLF